MGKHLVELLECSRRIAAAGSEEELAEALSDMDRIGKRSIGLTIAVQLAKIQLERPVILPLAAAMCGYALYSAVVRWVS